MTTLKYDHYQDAVIIHDEKRQRQKQGHQNDGGAAHHKSKQGICLLLLSAFLFSFMGMFLQFTGQMGIPSTELVFIRCVFQGIFVLLGMVIFRVDEISTNDSEVDKYEVIFSDVEADSDSNINAERVGMVPIHDESLNEEKKLDNEINYKKSQKCNRGGESSLSSDYPKCNFGPLSTTEPSDYFQSAPNNKMLPPLVIQHPFGTTAAMCKIATIRGIIGGFGFINYYYTLSTLPLGDATTLSSLYPIITIFLARIVLGEEIKPIYVVAALMSVVGAALISRPSFLFDSADEEDDRGHGRPPTLGYVTAMVGSMCASGVIVLTRKAGNAGLHTLQLLFSWVVFGVFFSLLFGVIFGLSDANQQWRIPSRQELPIVLGICASGTVGAFLMNYAGRLVPANLAGLLRSSDIFWAYLLGMIVLSEHPQNATWLGVLFVCSSLMLVLLTSND
eukprot:CAMPEP_0201653248 /NCGR_PEP_ID=MMETSP0493-20130528/44891_1 /ASSEMBLY_ACC=CAM_ASM_000838 /TAXON_ID=420259 /ORGANISM="Thalassiosira gravida, Strain GMp14c1" /LENGTH=446 /DNA_ID=CAMNT_0048129779 /DNA_START=153 /DNA_END=1493 /DNA_ORIENTATION=-